MNLFPSLFNKIEKLFKHYFKLRVPIEFNRFLPYKFLDLLFTEGGLLKIKTEWSWANGLVFAIMKS